MMLDMKRTFDEIVAVALRRPTRRGRSSPTPSTVAVLVASPARRSTWRWRSSASSRRPATWDLIVVDTPPTRSALDFLDAPQRLARFLDGRLLRLLVAPAQGGRPGVHEGALRERADVFTDVLTKIIGAQVLQDLSLFVGCAGDDVRRLPRSGPRRPTGCSQAPGTSFVVVAAPEPDALREAAYFVDRLATDQMPLAGLVLNRVHPQRRPGAAGGALAGGGRGSSTAPMRDPLAAAVLRIHAERVAMATRQSRLAERFTRAHPEVPQAQITALAGDVHDLEGLTRRSG